jgi:hypothetical protein
MLTLYLGKCPLTKWRGAIYAICYKSPEKRGIMGNCEPGAARDRGPMVHALDDELITANPVSGIFKRINAPRNQKREIDPAVSG